MRRNSILLFTVAVRALGYTIDSLKSEFSVDYEYGFGLSLGHYVHVKLRKILVLLVQLKKDSALERLDLTIQSPRSIQA